MMLLVGMICSAIISLVAAFVGLALSVVGASMAFLEYTSYVYIIGIASFLICCIYAALIS